MGRRLLTPLGGILIFLMLTVLLLGGLGWVTLAALKVENAEREATARADAMTKANLALWQLDGRLFPTIATETGRPYAQYFTLYMPHPIALDDTGLLRDPGRVPSPLLSAEFPDWMLLHFQLDPEVGWLSPQVCSREAALKLEDQFAAELELRNLTAPRQQLLAELQNKFEVKVLHQNWVEQEVSNPTDGPFGVPVPSEFTNPPQSFPNGPMGFPSNAVQPNTNAPSLPMQAAQPPAEYQSANDRYRQELQRREGTFSRAAKDARGASAPSGGRGMNTLPEGGGGFGGAAPGAPPAPKVMAPAAPITTPSKAMKDAPQADPVAKKLEEDEVASSPKSKGSPSELSTAKNDTKKPSTTNPPANSAAPTVQVGPIRPRWLQAEDGSTYLILVRVARLQAKTVFQGVVLDWSRLQEVLMEEIRTTLPQAKLLPVYDGEDVTEGRMASIPARLDPGPIPQPPPPGWSPLRIGLLSGWSAALMALLGIWLGGKALIDLSERRIRFVSAVTHELRTPLTSMRLYLDLLTSGMIEDEEKQKEYLRTLHGESDRLNRLIENVLDFAKLEKRTVQTYIATTKVDTLLEQARTTWTDRCTADGKQLVVIGTVPVDQTVSTDERMVGQILSNLIDNARKYSPASNDSRIWLWAKPGEGNRICFEVEDRGPGVALAERASIFRPFQRGQTADTTAGGAGLGLALAKQWAEMLGGRLSYRVADGGVGACFRLEIPI